MKRKREYLSKYDRIIKIILFVSKAIPNRFYLLLLKLIRGQENYIAMLIRWVCLKNCSKKCGSNVAIYSNVYLFNLHNLVIGDNVSIHPLSYINASGNVVIGDDVSIAHSSSIISEEHKYGNINIPIKDQGVTYNKITIKNNVWIGAGSRILAGSTIETGSIVAAGAVVKGNVSRNSIYGGVPAKFIKERLK